MPIDCNEIKSKFENLFQKLVHNGYTTENNEDLKAKLKSIASRFMKQNQFNSKAEMNILRNIKKRGLRICRFDKGNGVVVLNESDYFKKMHTILDTPMFERLKQRKGAIPPNIKDEESLRNILDDIKIHEGSSNFEKDVKNIYLSGSLPAKSTQRW